MDRGDRRVLDHLRHRVPAETMSLGGFAIGKDGYVARRVIEPGELQPSVLRGTFRGLAGKSLCVAGREIPPDLCTTRRIIDQDEPPRLAQTY
jgi:hypothetical protein